VLKTLPLFLTALFLLTACDSDEDSSTGAGTSTETASTTTQAASTTTQAASTTTPVASASTASMDSCAPGHYSFGTDADGKTHFDYVLQAGGVVRYNLTGGPVGRYTVSGSQVSMNNVFPGDPGRQLVLTVTQAAADCRFLVMRGAVNGAAVSSRRL
jgi:hypothetical protein